MLNNIDEAKYCIAGRDYVINQYLKIYLPYVYEVIDYGEDYYYHVLNLFIRKPYDVAVELDDNGIDYQTITDWDLFVDCANQIPIEFTCIFFGKFDFTKLNAYINENNMKILINRENPDIIIDEAIYRKIVTFLRYVHFISEKVEFDVGNGIAKRFLLDRMRRKQEKLLKDYANGKIRKHSQISGMIKFCVNNASFKYNYETVMGLKLNLLYESYFFIVHGDERRGILYGVYNGTIDTSKMHDKSMLDIIPDLHK